MARLLSLGEIARQSELAESTLLRYERIRAMPRRAWVIRGEPRWEAPEITRWLWERGPRRPPKSDIAECGTPAGWRAGCRCDDCTDAHNAETRQWRRDRNRLPDELRAALLADIVAGVPLPEAAETHGVTQQRLHGQAKVDPAWKLALDQALIAGRDPGLRHGEDGTYSHYRCRCPDCRDAHRQAAQGSQPVTDRARSSPRGSQNRAR